MEMEMSGEGVVGPLCSNCRRPLQETLRVETLDAVADGEARGERVTVSFCGVCGTAISAIPQVRAIAEVGAAVPQRVPDPEDPESLDGRFQLRCRDLIEEIQRLGFMPGGWIARITHFGAVAAARDLLSTELILPVTRWLVQQARSELTMEREITRDEWAEIFTDAERAEAESRLQRAGRSE